MTAVLALVPALLTATAPPAVAEGALLLSERAAVVEMRTAALIMSDQQGGALPIAVAAVPADKPCGDGDGISDCLFTALVEIDGAALLEARPATPDTAALAPIPGDGPLTVDIFAYVLGIELDVIEHRSLSLEIDLHRHRELLENTGVKAFLRFEVAPGNHQLRVLVHAGEVFGLRGLELPAGAQRTLPGDGQEHAAGIQQLAPIAVELAGPWLLAAPAGVEIPLPPPFGLDADSPLPAARPQEPAVASGDSEDVAPAALREGATVIADPSRAAKRQLARVAGDEYAHALSRLAGDDRSAALEVLRASERRVVEALDAGAVDILSQAQSGVLAPLQDAEWACVLPVILLHLDLSRAYRGSGQRILAHHATRMTIDLAEAYAGKLASRQAAAEAAQALTSLAGYYQHGGARSQSERLFIRALDLAGSGAPAFLGLATSYEKRGLYDQAVPLFESLVAERPEYAGGALRLALNRARTGDVDAAKETLGELAARRDGDWVTLLAHQELARLLIDAGRMPAAADLLRRGLERWPGHSTLVIQLAWVLDAQGESDVSQELLEGLASVPPRGNVSSVPLRGNFGSGARTAGERSRYNRWPGELLAASRRTLAETARRRLPDLDRWLSSRGTAVVDSAADGD